MSEDITYEEKISVLKKFGCTGYLLKIGGIGGVIYGLCTRDMVTIGAGAAMIYFGDTFVKDSLKGAQIVESNERAEERNKILKERNETLNIMSANIWDAKQKLESLVKYHIKKDQPDK